VQSSPTTAPSRIWAWCQTFVRAPMRASGETSAVGWITIAAPRCVRRRDRRRTAPDAPRPAAGPRGGAPRLQGEHAQGADGVDEADVRGGAVAEFGQRDAGAGVDGEDGALLQSGE